MSRRRGAESAVASSCRSSGEANPSISTLLRLADALEVTLTDLVSEQDTTTVGVRAPSTPS
jgi:transcriptional regulator with XRE-family HTH domain